MADKSKLRMNLAAIKKVDPYAKDIVDLSSHVAFYTFNSDRNEWEKTDVEGALFIYSRNAQPFNSIFINNRLNTTSFVEPITCQLELQSQPPFLLYRNERSRIRGFWFYNSQECDRIGNLVNLLVQKISNPTSNEGYIETSESKQEKVNIFNMLSKAQQEYNKSLADVQQNHASRTVLQFFASARPTTGERPFFQHILSNTLSVEQLEKQQRAKTPTEDPPTQLKQLNCNRKSTGINSFSRSDVKSSPEFVPIKLNKSVNSAPTISGKSPLNIGEFPDNEDSEQRQLIHKEQFSPRFSKQTKNNQTKPTLMPPTMFDKPFDTTAKILTTQEPLNQSQMVQALIYLIQNDDGFVQKLHEAYIKIYSKTLLGSYQ